MKSRTRNGIKKDDVNKSTRKGNGLEIRNKKNDVNAACKTALQCHDEEFMGNHAIMAPSGPPYKPTSYTAHSSASSRLSKTY